MSFVELFGWGFSSVRLVFRFKLKFAERKPARSLKFFTRNECDARNNYSIQQIIIIVTMNANVPERKATTKIIEIINTEHK